MNKKILKLAQSLLENKDCQNQQFHLTLNYKEVIKDEYLSHMVGTTLVHDGIVHPLINDDGFKRIEEELSKVEVKNFNLSVKFENGISKSHKYATDWYTTQFIFNGEENIEVVFDCLSSIGGLKQTTFNQFYKNPVIIEEDKIDEGVQNLVDLKNMLNKQRTKIIKQLNKFN